MVDGGDITIMTGAHPTGAELAADLLADATDHVFGVTGGQLHPLLVALAEIPDVTYTGMRDERAAIHAAHAGGVQTGDIVTAVVTTGPGFTNALTGIAAANEAGVPLLVVAALPPTPQRGRRALEELPQRRMVEPVVGTVRTVLSADRFPDHIAEAVGIALDENRPTYVEVPADVFLDEVEFDLDRTVPTMARHPVPPASSLDEAEAVLDDARRPAVIVGRGVDADSTDRIRSFVETFDVPLVPMPASKGVLDAEHELYLPGARRRIYDESDALLVLEHPLDFSLAYGSHAVFGNCSFVQVHPDSAELGRNRTPEVAIRGRTSEALEGLEKRIDGSLSESDWVASLRETHDGRAETLNDRKRSNSTPIHPYRLCGAIERAAGADAVFVCDGGDTYSFGRVGLDVSSQGTFFGPGPMGCLGVGVPFAIGVATLDPDSNVICLTGDGALGFNLTELETAAREGVDITVIVANNAAWNIERHAMRVGFGREIGTELSECRYDMVATGLGAWSERVTDPDRLDAAVAEAVTISGPALVDVAVDPDAVSPDVRNGMTEVWEYQLLEDWDRRERERREE